MTTMEIIVGAIATVLALIFGAFHLGKTQGKSVADAQAEQQRTEENATATVAVAERRADATKGASDVQEDVKRMGDDDIDRELRERFTRPGGG
jgi:FlaG/FlaF family flagellin (archaellin)